NHNSKNNPAPISITTSLWSDGRPRPSAVVLFACVPARLKICHPERSEGPAFRSSNRSRIFLITPCARLFLDMNQTSPKMFQTFYILFVSDWKADFEVRIHIPRGRAPDRHFRSPVAVVGRARHRGAR